jgi:hypothetical protein
VAFAAGASQGASCRAASGDALPPQRRKGRKRLREDLKAQSFGPGRDLLHEGACSVALVARAPKARAVPKSPAPKHSGSSAASPQVMSPGSLAFLETLHTGLTPPRDEAANGPVPQTRAKGSKRHASNTRQRKGDAVRNELVPVGLESFVLEAKARRAGLPLAILDAPAEPTASWKGAAAVGELRQALRAIDTAHPPPGLRCLQVAESEEEGSEDEFAPIAFVPPMSRGGIA